MARLSASCGLLLALLNGAAALVVEPRTESQDPPLPQPKDPAVQQLQPREALLQQEGLVAEVHGPVSDPHAAPHMEPLVASSGILSTYKLRLCNAFAWHQPLEMSRVQEPQLVEYPLPYKACHDYLLPLQEGDELQFKAGGNRIGSFMVRSLPDEADSLLLIVPHRQDKDSGAVVFESHIFKPPTSTQLAVIDVYSGTKNSSVLVGDRKEELPYNSVVAVPAGTYKFQLGDVNQTVNNKKKKRRPGVLPTEVVTKKDENYVILRVGMGDSSFPEELVAFPWSGASCGVLSAGVFAALASYLMALA